MVKAILISDIHFSLKTLDRARKALDVAVEAANNNVCPLIIAGDLHDTKANLRGECIKSILISLSSCITNVYVLVGNHDKINEKSIDHSLLFLQGVNIVDGIEVGSIPGISFVPYMNDVEAVPAILDVIPKDDLIIMHQGITTADMGHYMQDPTAIDPALFAGRKVISGHYHKRQTIKLPEGGSWTYLGNPYTLDYGESDEAHNKGYTELMDDHTTKFIPIDMPAHVKLDLRVEDLYSLLPYASNYLYVRVHGPQKLLDRQKIINKIQIVPDKLEFVFTDVKEVQLDIDKSISDVDNFDNFIDKKTTDSESYKKLWRSIYHETT